MAGNTNFGSLATTTLQNFANEIFDGVVTNNALLFHLRKAGNIKIVGGGRQFTHPVLHKQNDSFAAISKLGTIPTNIQDDITRAVYDIKVVAGSIVLSQVEQAMNAGDKEKLIDYVEEKKMSAEVAMSEVLGDQLFNTAVTASGSDNFDSIPYLINTVPTAQTDVGGIDSSASSQTFWRNYVHATAVTAFGTSQAGINAMDLVLNNSTYGRQGPKIIITTKAVYTLYNLALTANVRYSKLEDGDAGFKNLLYATLPVMFDDNCPTGRMYFIDTDSLKLQVLSQGNMVMSAFEQAHNQLVSIALMSLMGNLTCGSRRTQGVIASITG